MKLLEILKYYEHYIDTLLEAVNYNQMFSDELISYLSRNGMVISRTTINPVIRQAKSTLKREDRIVWFLRWWRLELIHSSYHKGQKTEESKKVYDNELAKYNKKSKSNITWE